ncbi:hypothetical protein REC12_20900 [Desulfosporosinus sp. PR]|uniref:hypothetical protein n=1 Tax=Candidatus Desulfosporosinus nitrosoreducens TaxID=3401928 RepID=UPI0027F2A9DA|nr:hypothetical protein [Desulfosporosinus sp. PR]MDQ7096058.1 hypothetical protein [Desulfosporosinus sp. PR]
MSFGLSMEEIEKLLSGKVVDAESIAEVIAKNNKRIELDIDEKNKKFYECIKRMVDLELLY